MKLALTGLTALSLSLASCASPKSLELSTLEYSQFEKGIRIDTKQRITAAMRDINNPLINRSFTFNGTDPVFNPNRIRTTPMFPGRVKEFERFAAEVEKAFNEEQRKRDLCMVAICVEKNNWASARKSTDSDGADDEVEQSRQRAEAADKAAQEEKIAKKLADIINEAEKDRHEACKRYGAGC